MQAISTTLATLANIVAADNESPSKGHMSLSGCGLSDGMSLSDMVVTRL
jgi:hypothetical protein